MDQLQNHCLVALKTESANAHNPQPGMRTRHWPRRKWIHNIKEWIKV